MNGKLGCRHNSRQARQDAMLLTARDIFLKKGFAATSMSEISQMVGGSKGTLWSYFPTKERLFVAVVGEASYEFSCCLESAICEGQELRQTLHEFATVFLIESTTPYAVRLMRVIASELERIPSLNSVLQAGMSRVLQKLTGFLKKEMASGRLRLADPNVAAHQFCALLRQPANLLIWFGDEQSNQAIDRCRDDAVDMFLRAYATDRP
ncbi:TetR/AcrR family transcriptional regulator [soil metagenome]